MQRSRRGCGSAGASPSRHGLLRESQRHWARLTFQPAKRPLPVAQSVAPVRYVASGERVIVMVRLRVLTG
jgi:hypothetical protein